MLDVIITSTCRKTIEITLKSFMKNVYCSGGFRFIVNVDVRNSSYQDRLVNFLCSQGINHVRINPVLKGRLGSHMDAINYLAGAIESPYYFHLEDDWVFLCKIDLDPILNLMGVRSNVHHIRFNKERTREATWLYHLSDIDAPEYQKASRNVNMGGLGLVETCVWSFNPSLGRTETLKKLTPLHGGGNPEKQLCSKYDQLCLGGDYGTYIYGNIGDPAMVKDIGRDPFREYYRGLKRKIFAIFGVYKA